MSFIIKYKKLPPQETLTERVKSRKQKTGQHIKTKKKKTVYKNQIIRITGLMIISNKLITLLTPDIQSHNKLTVKRKQIFRNPCIKN